MATTRGVAKKKITGDRRAIRRSKRGRPKRKYTRRGGKEISVPSSVPSSRQAESSSSDTSSGADQSFESDESIKISPEIKGGNRKKTRNPISSESSSSSSSSESESESDSSTSESPVRIRKSPRISNMSSKETKKDRGKRLSPRERRTTLRMVDAPEPKAARRHAQLHKSLLDIGDSSYDDDDSTDDDDDEIDRKVFLRRKTAFPSGSPKKTPVKIFEKKMSTKSHVKDLELSPTRTTPSKSPLMVSIPTSASPSAAKKPGEYLTRRVIVPPHPLVSSHSPSKRGRRPPRLTSGLAKEFAKKHLLANPDSEHVIVESARFQSRSQRRPRNPWTVDEEEALEKGVSVYGVGEWQRIRADPNIAIQPSRTAIDIKDKWRNRIAYRPYAANKIRRYILVDEMHQPRLHPHTNSPYFFNNRWPRDAAMKAASRDEMYNDGVPYCMIFLREVGPEVNVSNYDQIFTDELDRDPSSLVSGERRVVHVYKGTRKYEDAPNIEKFREMEGMWVAEVEKVREEKLLARQAVIQTQPIKA